MGVISVTYVKKINHQHDSYKTGKNNECGEDRLTSPTGYSTKAVKSTSSKIVSFLLLE
jgi:hypothetical protein